MVWLRFALVWLMFGLCLVTFEGRQFLQLSVLGQAETGRALAPFLLHQLRTSRVFDLVELSGRRRAVTGTLTATLLLLGLNTHTHTRLKVRMGF